MNLLYNFVIFIWFYCNIKLFYVKIYSLSKISCLTVFIDFRKLISLRLLVWTQWNAVLLWFWCGIKTWKFPDLFFKWWSCKMFVLLYFVPLAQPEGMQDQWYLHDWKSRMYKYLEMKLWIYWVLREAFCQEETFCCPVWGTENPPVTAVSGATAPGGSWSWCCPWRKHLGLRMSSVWWKEARSGSSSCFSNTGQVWSPGWGCSPRLQPRGTGHTAALGSAQAVETPCCWTLLCPSHSTGFLSLHQARSLWLPQRK